MKRNILLFLPDQHRGDWLPYAENLMHAPNEKPLPIKMPNLQKLMEQGTTFVNATTNSPLCVPARACLASGRSYERCGAYNNDFCYPLAQTTFYQVLKRGGYQVGGVGKFDLHKPILYWDKSGWLKQLSQLGFTDAIDSEGKYDAIWSSFYEPRGPYTYFLHKEGLMKTYARDYVKRYFNANDASPTALPEYAYADNWVTDNAINMLRQFSEKKQPWMMTVNFSGPHNPWDITDDMKKRWENIDFPIPEDYTGDPGVLNQVRQNYAAMLENIDANMGRILKWLEESGQMENTLIVYSSDHGEMMGDRSRYYKCVPYQGAIRIPMIIAGPGIRQACVSKAMVQLHDLAATFIDFAGLGIPEEMDALSLIPIASGKTDTFERKYQFIALDNIRRHLGPYSGYEGLEQYRKQKSDAEYIEEFNLEFGLSRSDLSEDQLEYHKKWGCVIGEDYKFIAFADGTCELYNLKNDPHEQNNIATSCPQIVEQLRKYLNTRMELKKELEG